MARFDQARWLGSPNETPGGMYGHMGLILHIQCGSEQGTNSVFQDPNYQASSHFGNPKSGGLDQWVDTSDKAWTEANGNPYWISIENEGFSGDSLTANQIENVAQLYAWLHLLYGCPLQTTDDPSTPGLGWHGMGGADWGGHYDCPGDPIKAQRPQILARTNEILGMGGVVQVPAATDKIKYIKVGSGYYLLQADGSVGAYNGAPFVNYGVLANDGCIYHFGPTKNNGLFAYPGLPAPYRQGNRYFVDIWTE